MVCYGIEQFSMQVIHENHKVSRTIDNIRLTITMKVKSKDKISQYCNCILVYIKLVNPEIYILLWF